jgi:hypothetical protein
MVDRARDGPQIRGLGPRVFLQQNNSLKIPFPDTLHLGPSSFPKSIRNPHIYRKPLRLSKIFPKIPLATFQKLQIGPWNSFWHIFATVTPNSVILSPEFLESLPLSFYAFI